MSTSAAIAVAAGGCVVVFGAIAWLLIRLRRSSAVAEAVALARLRDEGTRRGWNYAERDDSRVAVYNDQNRYTERNPLDPSTRPPQASAARDVVTGIHRGRPFLAAAFDTHYRGTAGTQLCVWVRAPAVRPALRVTKVYAAQSRVDTATGMAGFRTGDPDFDLAFEVSAEDDRFAAVVLNPRMTRILLADARDFRGFSLLGDQLDVIDPVGDHRDPGRLIPALDLRCDLLDLIPAEAWA